MMSVLIVDDNPENIRLLRNVLKDEGYRIRIAMNGHEALETIDKELPDLVLLDVMMPGIDGYGVCRKLKSNEQTSQIPVIFISALETVLDESMGLSLGAADYIVKPFNAEIVKQRVKNHLMIKQYSNNLESLVSERTKELEKTRDAVIFSMGALAEYRDLETAKHIRRTQEYILILARHLWQTGKLNNGFNEKSLSILYKSAPLHDVGKVGIPDAILLKPGKLTEDEFEKMRKHTLYGKEMIAKIRHELTEDTFLSVAEEVALNHHERWDGSGYPNGLAGESIPVSGRMMALADVYDALISKRVYKDPYSHDEAREMIVEARGTQFDPAVVDAFLELENEFIKVAKQYSDR